MQKNNPRLGAGYGDDVGIHVNRTKDVFSITPLNPTCQVTVKYFKVNQANKNTRLVISRVFAGLSGNIYKTHYKYFMTLAPFCQVSGGCQNVLTV